VSVAPTLEEIRKRLAERTKIIRERLLGPRKTAGEIIGKGGIIGGGRIITAVSETVDKVLASIKERRPNIVPAVMERIRTMEPGKRVKEILPPVEKGAAPPAVEEKPRLLRR